MGDAAARAATSKATPTSAGFVAICTGRSASGGASGDALKWAHPAHANASSPAATGAPHPGTSPHRASAGGIPRRFHPAPAFVRGRRAFTSFQGRGLTGGLQRPLVADRACGRLVLGNSQPAALPCLAPSAFVALSRRSAQPRWFVVIGRWKPPAVGQPIVRRAAFAGGSRGAAQRLRLPAQPLPGPCGAHAREFAAPGRGILLTADGSA
jgi:hypothetical protein